MEESPKGHKPLLRHPEKAHRAPQPSALQHPDWLKVRAPVGPLHDEMTALLRSNGLNTVCEEASCPNRGACWKDRHAAFMILGSICTRGCAFCDVRTGKPKAVDPLEPQRIAKVVQEMGLTHAVITSVDRDDLKDGGASQFVAVIKHLRQNSPRTTIEVLIPDFRHKEGALEQVIEAGPDIINHNIETVPRLYRSIRPGARYYHSLRLLDRVRQKAPHIFTKSGLMVGLGETQQELYQVMDDLRSAFVDFLTVGQYLQPSPRHAELKRYVPPSLFKEMEKHAWSLGFSMVSATPLTRSSYFAGRDFEELRRSRRKKGKYFP